MFHVNLALYPVRKYLKIDIDIMIDKKDAINFQLTPQLPTELSQVPHRGSVV